MTLIGSSNTIPISDVYRGPERGQGATTLFVRELYCNLADLQ